MTAEVFKLILTGFLLFGAGATVAMVDQPRKPLTPGVAVVSIVLSILFVAGIWIYL